MRSEGYSMVRKCVCPSVCLEGSPTRVEISYAYGQKSVEISRNRL